MTTRHLSLALACVLLLTASACRRDQEEGPENHIGFQPPRNQGNIRPLPTPSTQLPPDPASEDLAAANAAPPQPQAQPPVVETAPPPVSNAPVPHDYKYGIPAQGKPGLVISPYAPEAGLIDVKGLAPGSEAKDPYTNKVFLVP